MDQYKQNPIESQADGVSAGNDAPAMLTRSQIEIMRSLTTPRTIKQVSEVAGWSKSWAKRHVLTLRAMGMIRNVPDPTGGGTRVVRGRRELFFALTPAGESRLARYAKVRIEPQRRPTPRTPSTPPVAQAPREGNGSFRAIERTLDRCQDVDGMVDWVMTADREAFRDGFAAAMVNAYSAEGFTAMAFSRIGRAVVDRIEASHQETDR